MDRVKNQWCRIDLPLAVKEGACFHYRPSLLIRLIGLVEEKVRRKLFVLVACKVCLDDHLTLEAEST